VQVRCYGSPAQPILNHHLHARVVVHLITRQLSSTCTPIIGLCSDAYTSYTHTHPFNHPLSRTTRVSRYQKGKTNLYITDARDSEWQWHQLGHMQVYTSLQTDNHASTSPLNFLQAGCPSCRPTNSVKTLKAKVYTVDKGIQEHIIHMCFTF